MKLLQYSSHIYYEQPQKDVKTYTCSSGKDMVVKIKSNSKQYSYQCVWPGSSCIGTFGFLRSHMRIPDSSSAVICKNVNHLCYGSRNKNCHLQIFLFKKKNITKKKILRKTSGHFKLNLEYTHTYMPFSWSKSFDKWCHIKLKIDGPFVRLNNCNYCHSFSMQPTDSWYMSLCACKTFKLHYATHPSTSKF